MSSKLPILLAIAGVAYFISTASAEEGDDISGCMEVTACNYDSTATVDSGDCKYGDACDDDDDEPPIPGDLCGNLNLKQGRYGEDAVSISDDVWGVSDMDRCRIHDVRVSQEDINIADPQGRTLRVYFNADVYNKSESRCGETNCDDCFICWGGCACWFAPTNGTNVGGAEAGASENLQFLISAYPTGSGVGGGTTGWVNGDDIFTGYNNNISRTEAEDDLRLLEEAQAKYSVDIQIPSAAPLGSYSVQVKSRIRADTEYGGKFQAWRQAQDIFNVGECETSSEAENYETRFMSNQSFMTL